MHVDILIIGSGSANSMLVPELADKKIAIIEKGRFGGTCLNVGCIPTKMFVYTAHMAATPAQAGRFGLTEELTGVDWPAIRDRVFSRIDPISEGGREYRLEHPDNDHVDLIEGVARFTGPKSLVVDTSEGQVEVSAETIIIGAGSRPDFPNVEGITEVGAYTSDDIMRMEKLPSSLLILGSGFIAAEFGHIFSSLGVQTTLIARSEAVLRSEDADISSAITEALGEQMTVELGFQATRAQRINGQIHLHGTRGGEEVTLVGNEILVATGRRRNTDLLDIPAAGFDLDGDRLVVDEYQRVVRGGKPVEGVWALGDICSPYLLKHVANAEQRTVATNLIATMTGAELTPADHRFVPHAVFTNPEIGSVGMTGAEAQEAGLDAVSVRQDYADVAYGWAMEDRSGFVKLIVERGTTRILGAHIFGAQASILIQLLIQAMSTGQTAADIARTQFWIHPALAEVVENALLKGIDAARGLS